MKKLLFAILISLTSCGYSTEEKTVILKANLNPNTLKWSVSDGVVTVEYEDIRCNLPTLERRTKIKIPDFKNLTNEKINRIDFKIDGNIAELQDLFYFVGEEPFSVGLTEETLNNLKNSIYVIDLEQSENYSKSELYKYLKENKKQNDSLMLYGEAIIEYLLKDNFRIDIIKSPLAGYETEVVLKPKK